MRARSAVLRRLSSRADGSKLSAMQSGPTWKARSFWENVAAGLFATAVWLVGSRLLEPFWARLSADTGWVAMSEWIHEAGWLAFLVTIALWYVQHVNRGRHASAASSAALASAPPRMMGRQVVEPSAVSTSPLTQAVLTPRNEHKESASGVGVERCAKLMVREDRTDHGLSLSLHLRSSKPIPHLRLKITGVTRWLEDPPEFTPVLQFLRADGPWEVSRTGGEPLLHFDYPAHYQICAFGGSAASLQIVTKNGRGGCPLQPSGTFRLDVSFEGAAGPLAYTAYIRADGGQADFTTDPSTPTG
jgi:hypothetical protein